MRKEQVISIYGSHDASVTFIDKEGKLRVYEYERFVKKRYAMYSSNFDYRKDMGTSEDDRRAFLSLIKSNLKDQDIRLILLLEINGRDYNLLTEYFPNAGLKVIGHHYAHACSGYYPSKFETATIFSVDGGGWDSGEISTTKLYRASKGEISEIKIPRKDFGNPYSGIGYLISEISPSPEGPESIHALSYAGKIMGLCAYGKVQHPWLRAMEDYYDTDDLQKLCSTIGLPYGYNSIEGQNSYDLAATSQYVFEKQMSALIDRYATKDDNIVLVGGCALNVLFNQKLKEKYRLYVPPNPNDCGLSYGMFLSKFPELAQEEICYSGIEILDLDRKDELTSQYPNEPFSYTRVVELLKEGKILGIIDGNSEVGPRALGNRSIICDPSFPDMKDILNKKVKFREWFRPFAPVCLEEDMHTYFERAYKAPYMSYAPIVKEEYKEQLKTITHVDNTARLQTTNEQQHKTFTGILRELKNQDYIPVILNTSFNIRGKPILTTIEDALYVLDNTELDYVIADNKIIGKK